ncbi:hypothetical protein CVIRNUC_007559 [Coccomyxa viridis]|uniref:Uncharacterized protein n=1 Tax=Coccomyxa viridis TaxID=1274662 RepID=A0AAV1IED7_9CHLO|nr:hypothetical protein CVIRNUC_007559 [Coccomyxa viridis]
MSNNQQQSHQQPSGGLYAQSSGFPGSRAPGMPGQQGPGGGVQQPGMPGSSYGPRPPMGAPTQPGAGQGTGQPGGVRPGMQPGPNGPMMGQAQGQAGQSMGMRPSFSGGLPPGMRPQAQQPPLANGGPALQQGSMPGPRPTYGAPPMVPAGFQRGPPGGPRPSMPRPAGTPPGLMGHSGPPSFGVAPQAAPQQQQYGQPPAMRQPSGPPQFGAPPQRPPMTPNSAIPGPPGFGDPATSMQHPSYNTIAPPGYDAGATSGILDAFEAMTLGPGAPGQHDPMMDPAYYPRPTGENTEAAGQPPPPFQAGNCDPRFMRLTVNAVPSQQSMRQRYQLPFGAVVHPLADPQDVPVIGLDNGGIVRCKRCRTYINPFVRWSDGGRRFQCNVCGMLTEVPLEYYCAVDGNGVRHDIDQRPELSQGSVEYIAPQEYMVRAPMPPRFFFVIDVSYVAANAGALPVICQAIRDSLDRLPGGERTQIGFLTFDSTLHFYNLASRLSQPQMMVVADLEETFLPMPDDLVVNLVESRAVVEALLDSLPQMFAGNSMVESALGPALQAAYTVMQDYGGKMLVFQNAVPSLGLGKIKARDNAALWGTDAECKLRQPDDPFYKKFAAECSRVQIAVDIFAMGQAPGGPHQPPVYMDLASLGALPRYTCGQLYYYPAFHPRRDQVKLGHDVRHNLARPTAWEAVMRIRCSKGLRISAFHGHFFIRSSDLLALPQVDPDKAFAVSIQHDETVVQGPVAYMQCALLYTSSSGERRIRVHTLAMAVVDDAASLFRAADGAATLALLAKLTVEAAQQCKMEEARNKLQHKVGLALKEFRLLHAASMRGAVPMNKLIFPPALKYLPLWSLGLLKTQALRGAMKDVQTDERTAFGFDINQACTDQLLQWVYPPLYPVHDPSTPWGKPDERGRIVRPAPAPLTTAAVQPDGAYLMDCGRVFVMWLGRNISPEFMTQVFEAGPGQAQDGAGLSVEPPRSSELSKRINALLSSLRAGRSTYASCFVVRQGTPPEQHVLPWFVEDRSPGSPSYSDWANALHKAAMAK